MFLNRDHKANKNKPKVTIVIGNVKIIRIGLTINLSKDSNIATHSEAIKSSTYTPGRILAITITAIVVSSIFKIDFILFLLEQIEYQKKKRHQIDASFTFL